MVGAEIEAEETGWQRPRGGGEKCGTEEEWAEDVEVVVAVTGRESEDGGGGDDWRAKREAASRACWGRRLGCCSTLVVVLKLHSACITTESQKKII